MSVKIKVIKSDSVKYTGYFDLKTLIDQTVSFFDNLKYDVENPVQIIRKGKNEEGVYVVKMEQKLNDYFKAHGKITMVYKVEKVNVKDTEADKEFSLDSGEITITIEMSLEHDYDNKFASFPVFGEVIRAIVESIFMKETLTQAKNLVQEHAELYKQELLRYFNLKAIEKVK
ncbi:MAG: hypothetical protein QXD62_01175 [Candidatus Woesearchaeota archaeon]